ASVDPGGPDRFRAAAAECRRLGRDALADEAPSPAAGPVWVGGFAFAEAGSATPEWGSLPPALLTLPEVSLARRGEEAWLTASALVDTDDTPEATFIGASPELLVRRDGQRAQTVALAGTRRRSADPSVDRHLAEQLLQSPKDREEQAIVARRIERVLRPVSVWVAAAEEPVVVKVQNVQHLATPIRAQLSEPVACVELVGLLHPTPAVGGEPRERALPLIPA